MQGNSHYLRGPRAASQESLCFWGPSFSTCLQDEPAPAGPSILEQYESLKQQRAVLRAQLKEHTKLMKKKQKRLAALRKKMAGVSITDLEQIMVIRVRQTAAAGRRR